MSMIHRNATVYFTAPCLVTALIEWSALGATNYAPTWLLGNILVPSAVLLAVAVAITLVSQVEQTRASNRLNVTSFLPGVTLVFAAVVIMSAIHQPITAKAEGWTHAWTMPVLWIGTLVILCLGVASVFLALVNHGRPVSLHAFGEGRMYRASPEAINHALNGARAQAKAEPKSNQPGGENHQESTSASKYPAVKPSLTFADLYGNNDLKNQLAEAAQSWRTKGKNGVLLFGPAGTGKTAFGEALAGELGLGYIYVTFGDVASKWINQTTEQLVALFKAAAEQQPCVLFIDELDAVIKDREQSTGSYDEYERIVAVFLDWMVRLRGSKVLVVAATNHINKIDSAAIREGRFDFKIEVPVPDADARRYLIETRVSANGCTVSTDTLVRLVRRWGGFNVPRIIDGSNMACELAKDEGKTSLDYAHFYAALRKIQGRKAGVPEGALRLSDLYMNKEPTRRLQELASQLTRIDDIERLGGSVPTGLLFVGPPGTGKTATAMALARECGWTFIERNGRELMQPGEIDKLRNAASDLRPAIVFIDEADDILADRQYSGAKHYTNELLTLMNGAGGTLQDVLWVAATNHPEGIDSAAVRGGRFEQKIPFGLLDDENTLRMIGAWTNKHADVISEAPDSWALKARERLRGQTPSNIKAALELANNMAVSKHVTWNVAREVSMDHLNDAIAELNGRK
jgi:transitional endoplasmic reticulum ATPase